MPKQRAPRQSVASAPSGETFETAPSDSTVLEKNDAGELRVSKDELNLIEYPWIALWKCEDASTVIFHKWEVPHPTIPNKMVQALWRVAGDAELGLPTASDLRVYLVLMELTRDQGMSQIVHFTRWELLKRLGWADEKQRYDALRRAFRRLKGVTISAENAFRDGRTKALKDVEFSIIDNVEIVAARGGRKPKNQTKSPTGEDLDLPLSFFRWNDVIYNSLKTGYLATIDLDFALSLRNDVALSLYRLLSKKKYGGRTTYEMELREFYHRHLGLRPTPFVSKMKERLKTGHDELIERGFLVEVRYEAMKSRKAEKVIYVFKHEEIADLEPITEETGKTIAPEGAQIVLPALPEQAHRSESVREHIGRQMRALGVSEAIISILLASTAQESLQLQLDCLSDRKPKDAAATFVAAVRGGWAPPGVFVSRRDSQAQEEALEAQRKTKAAQQREEKKRRAEIEAAEALENAALDARFEGLAPWLREKIDDEVRGRMQFVLNHLGEEATRNGWAATRRQIMREWDETGQLEQSEPDEAEARRLQLRTVLSSDAEVEKFFAGLGVDEQGMIEAETQTRLEKTGMGHLGAQHAGRLGVRRTVTREWLTKGHFNPS